MFIVGLGNPGTKYDKTRHNAGFLVVDDVAKRLGLSFSTNKEMNAEIAEGNVDGVKWILVKPTTFMNRSGEAVQKAMKKWNVAVGDVIVAVDDVALPLGTVRVRTGGSAGGHNGLKSLIQSLGSDSFSRIRVGVDAPPQNFPLEDWVLARIPDDTWPTYMRAVSLAADLAIRAQSEGVPSLTAAIPPLAS